MTSLTPEFLRRRRVELGLTQADLAERLGVTQEAVSRWERGLGMTGHHARTLRDLFTNETPA
jgi:transcriptional regulator with XRE-family HTH domain